ncbi:zinc ribbon domain-containing protein [Roseiflexus sp.]|uniref:zinc ribbon domain-containing protein n=1 Tax=Roseiflexus sp. TaxID=2562120 RepID=UPI0021DD54DD|nr:zinc ribbon domain-containing protein [Roseiflexus sp.]GIW01845.1 MAG: zinc ribbon domain-containing protein [Roseiflexus sp.]
MNAPAIRRFCAFCGADLPPGNPRFCIECGQPVEPSPHGESTDHPHAVTGPTVRLANARTEQAVIGGTVKLPSSGAAPPGLWFAPELPGPDAIVAVYAPLRAIVGGWSGLIAHGWKKCSEAWAADGTNRTLVRFTVERMWFAAPGAAHSMRLLVQIGAWAHADEGRTRRGFRYRIGADPPMDVMAAWWVEGTAPRFDLPVPQIQIMAPPRIVRVSDVPETVRRMSAKEAETWARQGEVHGWFRMPNSAQQRTPVGRGIPLLEVSPLGAWLRLGGAVGRLYRVQMFRPLVCDASAWKSLKQRIVQEATDLGLDMNTDAIIEWWLDREGYDGALFERNAHPYGGGRAVIAFRRSQIALIEG